MNDNYAARFDAIMARIDAWAEDSAGWDCRDDAAAEVDFILRDADCADWDDDRIVDAGIRAWEWAE